MPRFHLFINQGRIVADFPKPVENRSFDEQELALR